MLSGAGDSKFRSIFVLKPKKKTEDSLLSPLFFTPQSNRLQSTHMTERRSLLIFIYIFDIFGLYFYLKNIVLK